MIAGHRTRPKSLFVREPETLDGYTPHFTLEETLLNYKFEIIQTTGWMPSYDDDAPKTKDEHSIQILGQRFYSYKSFYAGTTTDLEIAASIANEVLENKNAPKEVREWLLANAKELNNSKRYWMAAFQRSQIDRKKQELELLEEKIERAEVVHSMLALQTKAERNFSKEEKQLLLTEFSGEEWQE